MTVLALVGPTAAGKSAVALRVAAAVAEAGGPPVEIVAVDALTVYRHMDVGTAKASPDERARVPHHMVDVLDPDQPCTVEWFQHTARSAIDEVRRRGSLPLLVGGSGLYWRAVVDPLEFPPTDPEVRAEVEDQYPDAASAHQALTAVDPAAAARMDPLNHRRAVRALEVLALTGRRFSSYRTAWDTFADGIYTDLVAVGLAQDPAVLAERVAARTAAMLEGGLVEEAARLRARYGDALAPSAVNAIGYAQAFAHLDGVLAADDLAETITARTRRFAARQRRWFAADPRVRHAPPAEAAELLARAASTGSPDTGG